VGLATRRWKPRDPMVISFDALPADGKQTDRQTDGRTDTRSGIAERDKNLYSTI